MLNRVFHRRCDGAFTLSRLLFLDAEVQVGSEWKAEAGGSNI